MTLLWKLLDDFNDVVKETDVKHAVRLVQNEVFHRIELHIASGDVRKQSTRSSNNDVRTAFKSICLTFPAYAVATAIYSIARGIGEIRNSLDLLLNLDGQLTRWTKDKYLDTVAFFFSNLVQGWQDKGCGFSCTRLSTTNQIFAF